MATYIQVPLPVTDNGGSLTVDNLGVFAVQEDGPMLDIMDRIRQSLANGLSLSLGSSISVTQGTSPWVVSGTVSATQGTSPWVISGTVTASASGTQDTNIIQVSGASISLGQAAMAASFPVVIANDQSAIPVSGTISATQGTSPWVISGTVTANAGTNLNTSLLALESGGNLATLAGIVTGARAAVNPISGQVGVQGDSGGVTLRTQRVVLATDVGLPTGTNVIGHIIVDSGAITANQGGAPWTITGTGTAGAAAAGVVTVQGIASMTPLKVDGSGVTQPISGTVTATQGTTPWIVTTQEGAAIEVVQSNNSIFTVAIDNSDHGETNLVAADIKMIGGQQIQLGQEAAFNSLPVALASDQIMALGATYSSGSNFGFGSLGVRNDGANTTLTSTNNTWGPFAVDAAGRIFIMGSHVDNQVFVAGTNRNVAMGALVDTNNSLAAPSEDAISIPKMTSSRELYVAPGGVSPSALADDESSTPVVSRVGAVMMGMDSAGNNNIDRARLAKAHDLDTSSTTEYAVGVSLRQSASGGSVELGTSTNPLIVSTSGISQIDDSRRILEISELQQITANYNLIALNDTDRGNDYGFEIR